MGLPVSRHGKILKDHPLVGKKIKCLYEDQLCTIKEVVKMWYHGYFITLLADNKNRSTTTLYWENISSIDEVILESVKENHKNWEIID